MDFYKSKLLASIRVPLPVIAQNTILTYAVTREPKTTHEDLGETETTAK